jgi:inorganic pyrophosphatase
VLGVVRLTQREKARREENDRLIAVPTWNERLRDVEDYRGLPPRMREEIEQFFCTVTFFTDKDVRLEGWRSRKAAERLVRANAA